MPVRKQYSLRRWPIYAQGASTATALRQNHAKVQGIEAIRLVCNSKSTAAAIITNYDRHGVHRSHLRCHQAGKFARIVAHDGSRQRPRASIRRVIACHQWACPQTSQAKVTQSAARRDEASSAGLARSSGVQKAARSHAPRWRIIRFRSRRQPDEGRAKPTGWRGSLAARPKGPSERCGP